jgi:multidrug efflux system outer membrane protein
MKRARFAVVAMALVLIESGCPLGPNYKRPSTPMTSTFRHQARAEASSFADLPWWDIFGDPALKVLIAEALENSYDLQDAAARVEYARQNARMSTDVLLPAVSVSGGPSYQQVFVGINIPGMNIPNSRFAAYQLQGALSWEIDLWGRLRRLRQSAFAQFFAAEENRRGVIVSLIGGVAQSYFALLALDLEIEVTRRTVESRQETLRLFEEREAGGVGDALDTSSEQALLASARANLANLERQVAQTENQLAYLLGRPPGPIRRTPDLLHRPTLIDHPAGLPASLLERRPDVRQAEANLVSANALVGAAYAAMFPTISFSGSAGLQSSSLETLFNANAFVFALNLATSWLVPLLNGAQYWHRYRGQKAAYRQALADYRRTVLNAFVEVANALVAIKTYREQRAQLELEVRAQSERVRLAKLRFRNGVASYLDVVNAEQNQYAAELLLAQTIGSQFIAAAQLYRALGGGWQQPPAPAQPRRDR